MGLMKLRSGNRGLVVFVVDIAFTSLEDDDVKDEWASISSGWGGVESCIALSL